jgi:L-rhamnose-H+ transport protein
VAVTAAQAGATLTGGQNAIWALAVGAGSLANIAYTLLLLFKNKSWSNFGTAGSARNLLLAAVMGILWMAGVSIYGTGAASLGKLGAAVGWPLFMSMVIISGNIWGLVTGEWRDAPRSALFINLVGVAFLIGAIVVISVGSAL